MQELHNKDSALDVQAHGNSTHDIATTMELLVDNGLAKEQDAGTVTCHSYKIGLSDDIHALVAKHIGQAVNALNDSNKLLTQGVTRNTDDAVATPDNPLDIADKLERFNGGADRSPLEAAAFDIDTARMYKLYVAMGGLGGAMMHGALG
ncbi:hypothetical protein AC578_1291 [Pseudocercospora eumusae]|uniref:Uncharacterized protein n=1 Tax=Pseudocercospora eumusae TaxID=321146 RepID=A0A139HUL8_9PEZI|nr:hypothetical protein AC578_1291 [Pseudocercospora eumusae]